MKILPNTVLIDRGYGSSRVLLHGKLFTAAGLRCNSMAREWAKAFYRSKKWINCRSSYIKERILADGGLCEECHNNPGYIVHHKIILTPENIVDPEIALNHEYMEYVCKDCHDLFDGHGLNKSNKSLCAFDTDGQPISMREVDRCIGAK